MKTRLLLYRSVNSTADPAGFNSSISIAQLGGTITLRNAMNAVRNTGDLADDGFDRAFPFITLEAESLREKW